MWSAHESDPRLGPQCERPQIGGLEDRRGYDRVEASVAKIAPERSAGPLEHAHFDAGPLAGEPMQEQRCVLPAGEAREPHAKRAADPRPNVGAGLTCSLGGGQRDARPLEEQLARSRQVDAASVPVEQLNAELCLQTADLGGETGLGYPQAFCRPREAALLSDGDEIANVSKLYGVLLRL